MKISDATFVIFDVETTSLDCDDETTRGIVEVAAVAATLGNPVVAMWSSLVNPGISIPPEVSGVHGLTDRDVAGAPSWDEVLPRLHAFVQPFSPITKASHNFAFDGKFLRTKNGVCTERLARHLWKAAPNYKNATLRYWRGIEVETYGIAAHRALGDSLVTSALLRDLLTCPEFAALGIDDTDALLAFSQSPILHEFWPFGKYRGDPIDVRRDPGYVRWCLNDMKDPGLSPDMRYTLELQLKGAA